MNDKPNVIVPMDRNQASEALNPPPQAKLSIETAAATRAKLEQLRGMASKTVRTPEIDAAQEQLTMELTSYMLTFANPLLETYLAMMTEYRPLLLALQPVLARCGQFQMAAPKDTKDR